MVVAALPFVRFASGPQVRQLEDALEEANARHSALEGALRQSKTRLEQQNSQTRPAAGTGLAGKPTEARDWQGPGPGLGLAFACSMNPLGGLQESGASGCGQAELEALRHRYDQLQTTCKGLAKKQVASAPLGSHLIVSGRVLPHLGEPGVTL